MFKINDKEEIIPELSRIRDEISPYAFDLIAYTKESSDCIGQENIKKLFEEKKMVTIPYEEFTIMAVKAKIIDSFMQSKPSQSKPLSSREIMLKFMTGGIACPENQISQRRT